jgi:hypothetical protein
MGFIFNYKKVINKCSWSISVAGWNFEVNVITVRNLDPNLRDARPEHDPWWGQIRPTTRVECVAFFLFWGQSFQRTYASRPTQKSNLSSPGGTSAVDGIVRIAVAASSASSTTLFVFEVVAVSVV